MSRDPLLEAVIAETAPAPMTGEEFLNVCALVQSGIDGANLPLTRLLAETAGREMDAVRQIELKLTEAELWLRALIENRVTGEAVATVPVAREGVRA